MSAADPLLLFFTSWFGQDPQPSTVAGVRWTRDVKRLPEAKIVVCHFPSLRLSRLRGLPKYRGQVWVSWTAESDLNYPLQADPTMTRLFDISVRFDRSGDIWVPYLPHRKEWEGAQAASLPAKTESAPVAMFQSAATDKSGRIAYAAELMQHLKIDSYGRVLNNRTLAVKDEWFSTKIATVARYRFAIGFENARQQDYVTEKLFQPLLAGTVPIYRGAPNAAEFAPRGSFINADNFAGPKALADYINHLERSPDEYARYFDWRHQPLSGLPLEQSDEPLFARVVRLAAERSPAGLDPRGGVTHPFGLWDYAKAKFRGRAG